MLISSLFFTSNATEEVSNTKPWTYRNLKDRLIQLHIRLELYILSTGKFPVLFRWDCFIILVFFFLYFPVILTLFQLYVLENFDGNLLKSSCIAGCTCTGFKGFARPIGFAARDDKPIIVYWVIKCKWSIVRPIKLTNDIWGIALSSLSLPTWLFTKHNLISSFELLSSFLFF